LTCSTRCGSGRNVQVKPNCAAEQQSSSVVAVAVWRGGGSHCHAHQRVSSSAALVLVQAQLAIELIRLRQAVEMCQAVGEL
jgi:hypothetical protein